MRVIATIRADLLDRPLDHPPSVHLVGAGLVRIGAVVTGRACRGDRPAGRSGRGGVRRRRRPRPRGGGRLLSRARSRCCSSRCPSCTTGASTPCISRHALEGSAAWRVPSAAAPRRSSLGSTSSGSCEARALFGRLVARAMTAPTPAVGVVRRALGGHARRRRRVCRGPAAGRRPRPGVPRTDRRGGPRGTARPMVATGRLGRRGSPLADAAATPFGCGTGVGRRRPSRRRALPGHRGWKRRSRRSTSTARGVGPERAFVEAGRHARDADVVPPAARPAGCADCWSRPSPRSSSRSSPGRWPSCSAARPTTTLPKRNGAPPQSRPSSAGPSRSARPSVTPPRCSPSRPFVSPTPHAPARRCCPRSPPTRRSMTPTAWEATPAAPAS